MDVHETHGVTVIYFLNVALKKENNSVSYIFNNFLSLNYSLVIHIHTDTIMCA